MSHLVPLLKWYCCREFLDWERSMEKLINPIVYEKYSHFILATLNDEVYSRYIGLPTTSPGTIVRVQKTERGIRKLEQFYFGQDQEHLSYHEMPETDIWGSVN
jgi:hypothetical protein